ncbi:hypothetical protein IY73_06965 [Lawsonella clevelandensis]|uniref:1,4-dihydroxy-2-naphthoyl-CoA hydrolase n=1 Tax=Lawsonella clevelandensis TaxID=1528099 RepID=A0A5E3ZZV3_9ACTN|nr:acyl-CoA thioesterase [Lawsonella clevelandensis]ALE35004.1 hypothetical protein IY73_06965 [Lawsonella clevelandensis]VHO01460.1 1,4-dihydroxy-2-naphthoyl-CoA hydrolase [Lawsonella clevelandensis]
MSPRAGNYSCELEIRWSDFDQLGEVTDSTYIELAREARLRFVKDTWIRRGFTAPPMVVRHLEVDYLKPLLFGREKVKVELTVQAVTASSYTLRHELRDERGDVVAVVDSVLVAFDVDSRRQVELEPALQLMLTEYQAAADGEQ